MPSSSRKTITILNAVIGDGDEEVTTYCDLIDDGWVVKDIPKDQVERTYFEDIDLIFF